MNASSDLLFAEVAPHALVDVISASSARIRGVKLQTMHRMWILGFLLPKKRRQPPQRLHRSRGIGNRQLVERLASRGSAVVIVACIVNNSGIL